MARYDLTAAARYTEAATLLEHYLDNNAEDISPNLFENLNDLAGDIETIEDNYKREIDELEEEKKGLEERVAELENELEALK